MSKSILLSRAVATATAALCACLLAFASPARAFSPSSKAGSESTPLDLTTTAAGPSHTTSTGGASIVRTIVGLAIVIAVIWGLAWILRQVKAGKDPSVSSAGLASVAALTLGAGRALHLVRAGSDYVLVGATEHGVAPIHRYTEEEAREAGLFVDASSPEGDAPPEGSTTRPASTTRPGLRLGAVAGSLVAGAGRAVGHGSHAGRSGFSDEHDAHGQFPGIHDQWHHSPVVGERPDPMRAPAPSSGLIERLREMTVRR